MSSWIGQFVCGLGGHDELLHFEKNRVSLACLSCGHQSPGWEISGPQPVVTAPVDSLRHSAARPRLVETHRAA